jgi:hypothetical protein
MKTEILCILDRSGSMAGIVADSIGGFNTFLKGQKELPGQARVSLFLFDHEYLPIYTARDVREAPALTAETYIPRGGTALLDAIGRTIAEQGARIGGELWADNVVCVILTDGQENSSREYKQHQIATTIKHLENAGKWAFVYLGANQDAFQVAGSLGIASHDKFGFLKTNTFMANSVGTQSAYGAMGQSLRSLRQDEPEVKK